MKKPVSGVVRVLCADDSGVGPDCMGSTSWMMGNAPGPMIRSCAHRPAHGGVVPGYLTVLTGAFRRRPAAGVMAVSVNQTIVFWDRKAREMLGYTAHGLVGTKCSEIPSGLGRSGLTPECAGCCPCMRYARAGLVPPAVGTVVAYLFRERVTDVAPPVGDLVVVEQDDGADPQALTGGAGRAARAAVDASRAGSAKAPGAGLGVRVYRC